jgi:flagellar basal body-associated protein FliL
MANKACLLITIISCIVVVIILVVVLSLYFTCNIDGWCLNRNNITKAASEKAIYTGPDDYNIMTGDGFWLMHKTADTMN